MMCVRHQITGLGLCALGLAFSGCSAGVRRATVPIHYHLEPDRPWEVAQGKISVGPIEVLVSGPGADAYDPARWAGIVTSMLESRLMGAADTVPISQLEYAGGAPGINDNASGRIQGTIAIAAPEPPRFREFDAWKTDPPVRPSHSAGTAGQPISCDRDSLTIRADLALIQAGTGRRMVESRLELNCSSASGRRPGPLSGQGFVATLDPHEAMVALCIEEALVDLVSRLIPVEYDFKLEITSSEDSECAKGVRDVWREDYVAALNHIDAALRRNPDDGAAAFCGGVICEALGRYDRAVNYFRRAAELGFEMVSEQSIRRIERFRSRARPGPPTVPPR